jgi:protein O-mannosyl-transferase
VVADLVARIPASKDPRFKRIAIGLLMVFLLFMTVLRSATWGDPFLLATDLVKLNPQSPRASSDLATLYAGMSDSNPDSPFYSFAMAEFERGSKLPNASPLPEQGLILMAATTGQPVKDEWWDSLVDKLRTRPIGPQEMMAVTGLLRQRYEGVALDDGRLTQAYGTLLSRREMPAQLHAQFGDYALVYLGDEALAERMFVEMVDRSAGDSEYVLRVARGLASEGHLRQARAMIDRARTLGMLEGRIEGIDDAAEPPVPVQAPTPAPPISG